MLQWLAVARRSKLPQPTSQRKWSEIVSSISGSPHLVQECRRAVGPPADWGRLWEKVKAATTRCSKLGTRLASYLRPSTQTDRKRTQSKTSSTWSSSTRLSWKMMCSKSLCRKQVRSRRRPAPQHKVQWRRYLRLLSAFSWCRMSLTTIQPSSIIARIWMLYFITSFTSLWSHGATLKPTRMKLIRKTPPWSVSSAVLPATKTVLICPSSSNRKTQAQWRGAES